MNNDFVFYNNQNWNNKTVWSTGDDPDGKNSDEGDDEQIFIDFTKVPAWVEKIAITVTIHDAVNRRQNFGQVSNAYVRVAKVQNEFDTIGETVIQFDLEEEFSIETALVVCEIYRKNGERTIEAECDPNSDLDEATPDKVENDIREAIEAIELPTGYTLSWQGEGGSSGEAAGTLLMLFPIAFFLILVIMLLLFNSCKQVLIIVFSLPFIIVGIVPALLITGMPFTFIAILGAMGLIGMMIKNGIVLVDEINRLRKEEKKAPYDAVVGATVSRTSPVIMASLTTILGMAPLMGDPMYGSMAVCIMAGLAMGTLITLVFLPILYSTIFKVQKTEA